MTRQLRYSRHETQLALDLALFINGLPIATFELKNSLTKQTVADAIEQYQRDRDPRERLFEFGRCVVHFAVDDHEVRRIRARATGGDSIVSMPGIASPAVTRRFEAGRGSLFEMPPDTLSSCTTPRQGARCHDTA